jgi:3-oxoacyl-[acyl-carrier protein] reductase
MNLKGKVAIVTGGTSGIGKAVADLLYSRGAKVVVAARKKVKTKHYFVQCDVSSRDDALNLVKETIKKYKKVDILINNAGVYPFVNFKDMKEDQWDSLIRVNVKSLFNVTSAVAPYMMKRKSGRIVSTASIAGAVIGFPNLVHYNTSKGAVLGFTRGLALDLAKYGITVNCVAPGAITTPGTKKALSGAVVKEIVAGTPMGRMGKPEDIANAMAFLVADESSHITGQCIVVDGGFSIQ